MTWGSLGQAPFSEGFWSSGAPFRKPRDSQRVICEGPGLSLGAPCWVPCGGTLLGAPVPQGRPGSILGKILGPKWDHKGSQTASQPSIKKLMKLGARFSMKSEPRSGAKMMSNAPQAKLHTKCVQSSVAVFIDF